MIGGGPMEKVCGIYCIENLINTKKYIGQSIDIHGRWKDHKRKLNNNKHRNEHLQKSWNKYGENNFRFYILDKCDKSLLDEKEKYYINEFQCCDINFGYNIETGGSAQKCVAEVTKKKQSEARIGKYCGGENPHAHPVYCPQLDRWFACIADVEREGIAHEANVRHCLYGECRVAGRHPITNEKLTWYDETDFDDPDIKQTIEDEGDRKTNLQINPRCKPVYCPELNRIFMGGPTEVGKEGIANRTCVVQQISGRRKFAGRHPITGKPLHWEYIENNNT